MISIIGYIAMACLIGSAVPQAIKTIRDGHAEGLSVGYLVLMQAGFVLMLIYLFGTHPVMPVVLNYVANIVVWLIPCYYRVYPRK
jgi:uncharacterized protein with PQ loop repeat